MAKKSAPHASPQATPIPTSGGSYVVENGELRKREPEEADTPTPADAPATQE